MSKSRNKKQSVQKELKLFPAIEVFASGMAYLQVAESIFETFKATNQRAFYFPYLVLQSLAVEILFKSLYFELGRSPGQIHGIKSLFDGLPLEHRKRIDYFFRISVAMSPAEELRKRIPEMRDLPLDLESALARCNGVFTKIRYQYENQEWDKDSKGFAGIEGQSSIANALYAFIDERHPDWMEKFTTANQLTVGPPIAIQRDLAELFEKLPPDEPPPQGL